MKISNPYLVVDDNDLNLFTIRRLEYENIMPTIRAIVQPALNEGYELKDFRMDKSRRRNNKLQISVTNRLVLKLAKGDKTFDLTSVIPKLIKDQYFVINGSQKIPLFQLYDIPVVTRSGMIKIKTNASSIGISFYRKPEEIGFRLGINFQGRKVPLAILLYAYFGKEKLDKLIHEEFKSSAFSHKWFDPLYLDVKELLEDKDASLEDVHKLLGYYYSSYDPIKRADDVKFALDILLQVDIMSQPYFKTTCMPLEILRIMTSDGVDDSDFINKRIRCFEYVIYRHYIKAIYDLITVNRNKTKFARFNVNSGQILKDVNLSDIVQFDFSINPIEELTKMSRTSVLGPGGFKRKEVPKHLRDIHPSMYGRICPVDTPDRDNCGVLQNLLPLTKLDPTLRFAKDYEEKYITSIPVSMVPFCEHNDQTRLQMASSQMRQAIHLVNFESPMIKSGCEHLYSEYTQFCQKAKKDGMITYLDDEWMIVKYDGEDDGDIYNIAPRQIYVENMDQYKVYFKLGDKFKKGDILFESDFMDKGSIQFGNNVLVGFMSYYGDNFEDGIVISDRLVKENILTSKHIVNLSFTIPIDKVLLTLSEKDYSPLPKKGEFIKAGQPYAKIKEVPVSPTDIPSIFEETNVLTHNEDMVISKVAIYANDWNRSIQRYSTWVNDVIEWQRNKNEVVKSAIKTIFPLEDAKSTIQDLNLDIFNGKDYKIQKDHINGIYVEMEAIVERPIKVGDKIGNRHGNKGVITKILPEKEMPQLEEGKHLDVCLGPLGVPSRMNIGQLYEIYLSKVLEYFKEKTIEDIEANVSNEIIKNNILHFIRLIDKTENNWYFQQFTEQLPDVITKEFVEKLDIIQPPFNSISIDDVQEIKRYTGVSSTSRIYDPKFQRYIDQEIGTGYMYMFKMTHMADGKLAARSIGPYSRKFLQPLAGKKNKGGQRLGEMEQSSLIAYGAHDTLYECFTLKSDSIDAKNDFIQKVINTDRLSLNEIKISVPESIELMNKYCTVLGFEIKGEN